MSCQKVQGVMSPLWHILTMIAGCDWAADGEMSGLNRNFIDQIPLT